MAERTEDGQSPSSETSGRKLPTSDRSLHLVHRRGFTKRSGRVLLVGFGGLAFIAVALALGNHPHGKAPSTKTPAPYASQVPSILDVGPADYASQTVPHTAGASQPEGPAGSGLRSLAQDVGATAYPTYREAGPAGGLGNAGAAGVGVTGAAAGRQGSRSEESEGGIGRSFVPPAALRSTSLVAERSPLFFTVSSAPGGLPGGGGGARAGGGAPAAGAGAVNESDYVKQNMAAEKQAFLSGEKGDYAAYLNNRYITPVDVSHEILAGTVIPITMVTGINSDLPGEIIAQVNRNVYDTISGANVLIPAGSRLLGRYDNSVAFGQNRVLVAWNRLIEPNGVSIGLEGMSGTDRSGKAGYADNVNEHFDKLLEGVGLATVFNVATAAGVSALSTASFLQSIGTAVVASGSTASVAGSQTQAIVEKYATKLLDQQPTIVIRSGYEGYVLVGKDMILPAYPSETVPYTASVG